LPEKEEGGGIGKDFAVYIVPNKKKRLPQRGRGKVLPVGGKATTRMISGEKGGG